jgi:hypothetical protein
MVVWRQDNEVGFCLWEVKHYVGGGGISGTVKVAYDQLDRSSLEYLAKMTGIESVMGDDILAPLYHELVDLWVDEDPRCGAGVSVSTHHAKLPKKCFTTMSNYFPAFDKDWQLEGLVTGIGDFHEFCVDVRKRVWTAL